MQLHESSNQSTEGWGRPSPEALTLLSTNFAELMRATGRMKQQFAAAAEHSVEFAAQTLLAILVEEGPLRVSLVAEHAHSDPSTISRQVVPLIRDGLIERQVDQADGRASVLAVTAAGRAVYEKHVELRTQRMGEMLADWTDEECRQFAGYLCRVTDAFEEYRAVISVDHGRGATHSHRQMPHNHDVAPPNAPHQPASEREN